MPIVEIKLVAGRSTAIHEALMAEVAQLVARHCDVPLNSVRVILQEIPPHHWSIGGVPKQRSTSAAHHGKSPPRA
ncbi:MAG: 4-oxalocrotonate tautomerase family protein [Sphingomonadaceae bacterium]